MPCFAATHPSALIVIGLTGGIAAGKSTVARQLEELGAVVIDADKLGHRVYEHRGPYFAKIVGTFGARIVGKDGLIDRKALGAKVFGDKAQLRRLTDIVWPVILMMAKAEIATAHADGAKVVVLEAAVLIEANWQQEVDEVWAVTVEPEVAVARALARDGMKAAAVRARIDAQIGNAERAAHAKVVIDNSGDAAALRSLVEAQWQRLQAAA